MVKEVSTKNKKTDYVLIKLINKRTAVVIELKPMVGEQLGILQKELAQLCLEVYYAREQDIVSYKQMLAILSDGERWHLFVINIL